MLEGFRARMESELIMPLSSASCIRFWYHMKQVNETLRLLGSLSVFSYNYETKRETLMWRLKNAQGATWQEGKFKYIVPGKHVIIFEAVRGSDLGDIALDDISVMPASSCSTVPDYAEPAKHDDTNEKERSGRSSSTGLVVGLLVSALIVAAVAAFGYVYVKKREMSLMSNLRQRISFLRKKSSSNNEGVISFSNKLAVDS